MIRPFIDPCKPYKDPNGDENRDAFFKCVAEDVNSPRTPGAILTASEIRALGEKVLNALAHDADFRLRYYNLSRTWHNAYYQSGTAKKGGEYGNQLCRLFEQLHPPALLQLDDIANLHRYVFLTLRRSVLAMTGHDIDPDAGHEHIESYHFPPNDGSNYTMSPKDLGFNEALP